VRALEPAAELLPPSGAQFVIERAGQRAVVTEVGATLRSWTVDGEERLDGFASEEVDADFRGKVLAPWPNRIRDGRYAFARAEHRLPVDEPERGCAIHGLVLWSGWRPLRRGRDHVALVDVMHARPGYPFTLGLEVEYRLGDAGLAATLRATNLGGAPAPFGAGFHPYLALGAPADDARLEIPAAARIPVDAERLLPTGPPVPVDGSDHDFRQDRPVGDLALDTCFTRLARDADGLVRVRLTAPDGMRTTLWLDAGFGYVQAYTADAVGEPARRRRSIAIEPLTCAPDAFNTGEGLLTLAPGASFVARWGLSPR
jgi:aldose 1-epimerase